MRGLRRIKPCEEALGLHGGNIYSKLHVVGKESVLACCDAELIGKLLKQGEITFRVDEEFYGNMKTDERGLAKALKENANINLVGKKAVGVALREGIISEKDIIKICGIPHVQIIRI